jgi:nucleotide-binding universal stress UspA family protein
METRTIPSGTIVVGVDGSPSAARALEWAIDQARHEHRALTLVHGIGPAGSVWRDQVGLEHHVVLEAMHEDAQHILTEAREEAGRRDPDIEVFEVLRVSDPRQALIDLSPDAEMLVMGSRGRGPVASLLLGSVSVAVTRHASCPVVVVRPGHPGTVRNGVLVGVDGTSPATETLEFAYRMASVRGLPLTVMHCFWDAAVMVHAGQPVQGTELGLDDQRMLLAETVSGMTEKYPDVHVRTELSRGLADEVLVRAGQRMDLVVVGAHHGGHFNELVYGSVASSVVEHATCPVAVVPEEGQRR